MPSATYWSSAPALDVACCSRVTVRSGRGSVRLGRHHRSRPAGGDRHRRGAGDPRAPASQVRVEGDRDGPGRADSGRHGVGVDGGRHAIDPRRLRRHRSVLRAAMAAGRVTRFGFERRRLTEVFREAMVSRSSADGADTDTGRDRPVRGVQAGRPPGRSSARVTRPRRRRVRRAARWRIWDIGLVAAREVRERIRGRVFRVGTLMLLAVVAAASSSRPRQRSRTQRGGRRRPSLSTPHCPSLARATGVTVDLVHVPDAAAARPLCAGRLDMAVNGRPDARSESRLGFGRVAPGGLARTLARTWGQRTVADAGLSPAQATRRRGPAAPGRSLEPGR